MDLIRQIVESPDSEPFLSEPIERSRSFLENYGTWLDSEESLRQRGALVSAFVAYPSEVDGVEVMKMDSKYGNGLVLQSIDGIIKDEWKFLLDLAANRMRLLDYINMMSDVRHFDRGEQVETIERYYFKPKIAYDDSGKRIQRYGNILITLESFDEQPKHMKIQGSIHHGFNYVEPEPFIDLVRHLFEPES